MIITKRHSNYKQSQCPYFFLLFPLVTFAKEDDKIVLYLFHGRGCPHCAEEQSFLNNIKKDYTNLKIVKYEVWYNEENALMLEKIMFVILKL